ncbi:MAG: hypothetical protein FJ290_02560 [Planctomycetes bacterium]|nr:hypothetical protein [Planctomycetota bacterium]
MLANPVILALVGVLAGLIPGVFGGGGGWLLVPILVALTGPGGWAYASGTIVCAYLSGVAAGVLGEALAGGREVAPRAPCERRVTAAVTAGALAGTVAGKALLRDWMAGFPWATAVLDWTLIVALAFIAWRMAYEAYFVDLGGVAPRPGEPRLLAAVALLSLAPGLLAGLIGIGGGIFYVPILMLVLRWRPDEARRASRFAVLVSSLVAAALYALSGGVHVATAAAMLIPAGIVGVAFSAIRFGHSQAREKLFKLLAAGMAALAIALTIANLMQGGGSAEPAMPGTMETLVLALYVPVSWGAMCAIGQRLLRRKLKRPVDEPAATAWFYQI